MNFFKKRNLDPKPLVFYDNDPAMNVIVIVPDGAGGAVGVLHGNVKVPRLRKAMGIDKEWLCGARVYMRKPYPFDTWEEGKYDSLQKDHPDVWRLLNSQPIMLYEQVVWGFIKMPEWPVQVMKPGRSV